MPRSAPKPCSQSGCPEYSTRDSRCDAHQRSGWESDRRRGSRHERGYDSRWERTRERILIRDGRLCQPCKQRGVLTPDCNEVDHLVPKAEGGTDRDSNLQTICQDCHKRKTREESRRGIGGRKVSNAASGTAGGRRIFTSTK